VAEEGLARGADAHDARIELLGGPVGKSNKGTRAVTMLTAGPVWEGGGGARPKMNTTLFYSFKSFPKRLELIRSKNVLPVHQNFQIIYGCVDDLIRNKFPH
jgi:hypothetical protein